MLLINSPICQIKTDLYNEVDVCHLEAALDGTIFINNEIITLQSSKNNITLSVKVTYSVTVAYRMTVTYRITLIYRKAVA